MKKGFTKENKNSLLKDIGEISLEKYLSEVTTTINEVTSNILNKNDEISTAVEIISAMHQRFNTRFTVKFFELFLSNFVNPIADLSEKEETLRVNKLKGNLRVLTELYLVHVFTSLNIIESKENIPSYLQRKIHRKEPFIYSILKEILNYKFRYGNTTTIGTTFVKRFPTFFDEEDDSWDHLITDGNLKVLLQSVFKAFSEAVISRMTELETRINKLMKEHKKCQIRTGKLEDEYIEEHDQLLPIHEKFKAAAQIFSEAFNLELPQASQEIEVNEDVNPSSVIINQVVPPSQRLWENDDVKMFYENLTNIDDIAGTSTQLENNATTDVSNVSDFFNKLELCETKEEIDNLTIIYWKTSLDNKATRNRLLKFFIETQDWSKITIYARFLATNSKKMPEIIEEFVKYLDNGFRIQLHSNKINVKNIIFFSEMIKFSMVPPFMIFHKIRTLIINLQVPNNIEILTIFFEHSGKFLLNKPEYKPEMEKMIQLLKSKMKEKQLTMDFKSSLDNIIALLYPPSVKSLNSNEDEETPEQLFYRVLIRKELSNFDYKQSLILVRRANWENEQVYQTLFLLFSEPEKTSYQNIPILTKMLNSLYTYHRNFVIQVVDQILENIDIGLEIDDFSKNLQRIAQVRYLTEIFNLEMIKSNVLLDVIYQIIRYGHYQNNPNPRFLNQADLPNNYFRIQLVVTILLNIERFPSTLTKQLELLLRFFEYYIFTKSQPLPMETKFRIEDVFDKYSSMINFDRSVNLIESAQRFQTLIQSINKTTESRYTNTKGDEISTTISNEPLEDSQNEDDDDEEEDNDEGLTLDDEDDENEDLDIENEDHETDDDESELEDYEDNDYDTSSSDDGYDSSDNSTSDDDFGDINANREAERKRIYDEYEHKLKSEEEQKVEEELEKQFQQLMMDSLDSRKSDKITTGNMPIMSYIKKPDQKPVLMKKPVMNTESKACKTENTVAFTFVSKSGKKTNSRILELPKNVKFVSGVLEEEEKMKDEREKIKKMVLQRSFD